MADQIGLQPVDTVEEDAPAVELIPKVEPASDSLQDDEDEVEASAYIGMHELRLDYAIGYCDDDPEKLTALSVLPKLENGKHFYEVLDEPQIASLSVGLALGYFTAKQVKSVKTKFPNVDWNQYSKGAFLAAVREKKAESAEFRGDLLRLKNVSGEEHNELLKWKHNGLSIGLFLREMFA